jgi:hypothetical protein
MPPAPAPSASAELNALRNAVTCVVGFAELLVAEAGGQAPPDAAWLGALEANGRELLAGFARLERALRTVEAQAAATSAGGSYR